MNNALRNEFKRKYSDESVGGPLRSCLEILFEEQPKVESIDEDLLWQALHTPMRWIQVNALYEIFRRRGNQLNELPDGARISLAGSHSWEFSELNELLDKQGYQLEVLDAFPDGNWPDAIVLGPAPEHLTAPVPSHVLLLREEDLTELAIRSGAYYLLQEGMDLETGNLKTMLLSKDRSSIELGLQIMEKGGMPQDLITVLFAIRRSRLPWRIRQIAAKFLLRFTSGIFKQNLLRNYFDLLGTDRQLLGSDLSVQDPEGLLDIDQYLRLNFHLTPGNEGNAENLVTYHNGFKEVPESEILEIMGTMESEKRLRFPKTTEVIPLATYKMEHLKSIEIYHAPITSLPDGISSMPSLVRIWFNCPLESIPADLEKSPSIRWVNLFNGSFPHFPPGLAKLARLKIFRWEFCLADPEQILILPEELFQRALNTAIIIEQQVQFPESFFTCLSLKSLAISYPTAMEQLHRIVQHPGLQRIRVQFTPEEETSWKTLKQFIPGWRLEDQNERNYSFVKM